MTMWPGASATQLANALVATLLSWEDLLADQPGDLLPLSRGNGQDYPLCSGGILFWLIAEGIGAGFLLAAITVLVPWMCGDGRTWRWAGSGIWARWCR